MKSILSLPSRIAKPRSSGLTCILDNGTPIGLFKDYIESYGTYIDLVKFGWGTSIVTPHIREKIACLRDHRIDFHFGGTLFEKSAQQGKFDEYLEYCHQMGCSYLEISNGTIDIENEEKCEYIKRASKDFKVLSEVGFKDSMRSLELNPSKWIAYIKQDMAAGSVRVITEARESGKSGICRADGEIRFGLISEIVESDINIDKLVFEAPNKTLQTYFIEHVGANVNLANIAFEDTVPLETLRQGLRSDTLMHFEEK